MPEVTMRKQAARPSQSDEIHGAGLYSQTQVRLKDGEQQGEDQQEREQARQLRSTILQTESQETPCQHTRRRSHLRQGCGKKPSYFNITHTRLSS